MHSTPNQPPRWTRRSLLQSMGASLALAGCASAPKPDLDPSLTDELAYDWGLEAYLHNYPLAYFARFRALRMLLPDPATRQRGRWGQWTHRTIPVTPDIPGAPQTDTLYSGLWLDVRQEPWVVVVPPLDGRYWSIQCCDFMGVTFGLLSRRNFGQGGAVLVAGADWSGAAPEGMPVLRARMAQTYNLLRLFFRDAADLPIAARLQEGFQAVPLSAWMQGARGGAWSTGSAAFRPAAPKDDSLADFRNARRLWAEVSPLGVPQALTQRWARLGLIGAERSLDDLPERLVRALESAEAEGRRRVSQASLDLPGTRTANGWIGPRPSIGYYNDGDHLYRAAVTLAGTVALPAAENPYYVMQTAPDGLPLHGDRRYALRFERDMIPEVDAFWSLHAYNQAYKVIANPIHRYAIGDRSEGLVRGADGSLTLWVQADDPGDERRANWLPVRAGEPFWLIVRAYEPRGKMRDLTWEGPAVRAV